MLSTLQAQLRDMQARRYRNALQGLSEALELEPATGSNSQTVAALLATPEPPVKGKKPAKPKKPGLEPFVPYTAPALDFTVIKIGAGLAALVLIGFVLFDVTRKKKSPVPVTQATPK